jgi:hypothetical protein
MENVPYEIILQIMSHMGADQIINYCKQNRYINTLCKQNKNLIAKYALQNDYGFTRFSNNHNYASIIAYLIRVLEKERRFVGNMVLRSGRSHIKKFNDMLIYATEDDRLDVLQFLVENGGDKISYGMLIMETMSNDSVNVYRYLLEIILADAEDAEDVDEIFVEGAGLAFLFLSKRIVNYLINNHQDMLRDSIDYIIDLLEERRMYEIVDYVEKLRNATDMTSVESFDTFIENIRRGRV